MRDVWKKASCAVMLALLPCVGIAAEGAISFNKAPAKVIVEVTDAIVAYREKNGPFKTAEDLRGVPGMTSVIFGMLGPVDEGGDVLYEAEIPTGMHSY